MGKCSSTIHFIALFILIGINESHQSSSSSLPLILVPKVFRIATPETIIILPTSTRDSFVIDIQTEDGTVFTKYCDPPREIEPYKMSITIDKGQTKVNPGALTQRADFRILGRDGNMEKHKIALSYMNGLAFVQTDRPIYTPRDTVKIRMMRLDDNLKPKLEPLRLQIKSPQKIIMDEVTFNYNNNDTDDGSASQSVDTSDPLIDYEFKIPPDPIENTWQVVMSYGPNFGASTNASFVVKKYTLPPFKIKINSPKYISPSSSAVNGSVEVFYLNNGKPVTGTARFIFKVKLPSSKVVALGQTSDKELEDGRLTYEFAAEEFKESNLWFPDVEGGQLVVEVVVVELPTGTKMKKIDSSTFFFRQPYKVSFKNSYKTFRSDHPIQLAAEIVKHNDQPVSNVRATMWIDEDPSSKKSPKQVISDDIGQIKMEYQLPETLSNAQSITLAVQLISDDDETSDSRIISHHSLKRFDETLTTLTLINRKDRFKVGQTYSNTIIFEGNTSIYQPGIYYSLIVQGKIHTFGKLPSNDQLQLVIGPEMVPAFRLLVFCYRHDRVVSDSILVHVDQPEDCGLSVEYRNSRGTRTGQIQPGENGSLLIKSSAQSHVALRGVDEAIFSLEDDSVLTRQELINVLRTKDLGCGPGGGFDSKNIITNSGLLTIGLSEDKYQKSTCGTEFDAPKETPSMSRRPKNFKKNRRVYRAISHFRNDDEISSRNLCCHYGLRKDLKGRSCTVRHAKLLELLAYYTNCTNNCHQHSCAIEYLSCCRSTEPSLQFAVAGVTPHFDDQRGKVSLVVAHETYVIADDQLEESTMIRDDFRETWLFDIVKMNDSDKVTYPIKVPHSITSWRLDALAVSADKGLCLMKEPLQLQSTKILFIRVDLPYSVVQEEQIEMLVTLFNYGPKDLSKVRIYIYGIDDVCSEADPGEKSEPRVLTIEAGSAHTEAFALLPLKPGEYNIKVAAFHSSDLSDIVVKKLHVVPRGIEVLNDYRIQLDPQNRQRRNKRRISDGRLNDIIDANKGEQKTTLNLTQEGKGVVVIPGSERSIISAIANHFTPTNDDAPLRLDHLIRKPGGCGEQNIIYMAPTLLALEFLNSTTMLTANQSEKGINYLREGYKQQLTFLKEDGSYSAFKKRKSSVWLTGFVLKIFCRSKLYLGDAMDSEVLKLSAQYLIKNQHEEGYWMDAKPVLHRNIMGGIVGIPANTAFILNSLQTCASIPKFANDTKLSDAIEKAEEYLCAQIKKDRQMNAYSTALTVYSLSGASCLNDSERDSMLIDLKGLSVHDLDQNQLMWPDEPRIETAGYALMGYLRSKTLPNARDYAQAIVNWLESRRTFSGSFDATQDTIVALEALSQFARSQNKGDINLLCNITLGRYRKHIEFHPYNAQIMQTFEIPGGADDVYIHTKGVGFGSLQVQYKYNILEPKNKLCGYELEVVNSDTRQQAPVDFNEDDFFEQSKTQEVLGIIKTIGDGPSSNKLDSSSGQEEPKKEPSHLNNLKICVRSLTRHDAGMSIVEVGILSGYEPIVEDLDRLVNQKSSFISKYERLERKVTFYLDSVPGTQSQQFCFTFGITQHHFVSNLQSALVRVYDYYAEDEGCSQLYYAVRRTEPLTADCQQNPAVCECAANSICPVNKNLEEIGEIATYNMKRAHEKMEKFLCSSLYEFVWLGKIQKITEIDKYYQIDFKVNHIFRGNQSLGQVVTLMIDLRCVLSQTIVDDPTNLRFLVMGRKFDENIFIDSRSIFMDLKRKEARRSEASVKRIIDDIQSPDGEKMDCPVSS